MPVIYAPTLRSARLSAVVSAIGATGFLVIGTSALDGSTSPVTGVLAVLPLGNPAGVVTGDVLTLSQPISAEAVASGVAAKAEIWDTDTPAGAEDVIVTGLTVGIGTENVVLGTVDIQATNTVTISPATITHPSV